MRALALLALAVATLPAAAAPLPPMTPDIPAKLTPARSAQDFDRREVMIPMRDGVKLHTVITVPRGAKRAPIILTRTPYNASKRADRANSEHLAANLPSGDDQLAAAGYIRVFQDVRGKYTSEGDYVMTRPLAGPLNDTKIDHATDAYDTIDWLVKAANLPESNGRVGMIGSSYEGFTVLMALVHPHPALRAAVPMSPMVDGWKGDDWFHNGAFRTTNLDYIAGQTSEHGEGKRVARSGIDDYEMFRRAGSLGDYAKAHGLEQYPAWVKMTEHPAYDAFWQGQALDQILGKQPLTVPTMIVASQWDQEDMYGALATYAALEPKDTKGDACYVVLGPWRHSGVNYEASTLGPLHFEGDTSLQFRRDVMQPFLDAHLQDTAPRVQTPAAFVFETGTDVWRKLPKWPLAQPTTPLYLQPGGHAGWDAPRGGEASDDYVSDPAKPVPYIPRPVRPDDSEAWRRWLVSDQRAVADRTDVLVYETPVLTAPVHIAGAPAVDLYASTSGTDSDWVVKLVDVYPDEVPAQPDLGGYQLGVGMDIFRGRYRESFEHPTAIPANTVQRYKFSLPSVDHVFLPGHRIMVQVQSSWFPLYDRNPQTFVENIFFAKAADYVKATQRVFRGGAHASAVLLPVIKN